MTTMKVDAHAAGSDDLLDLDFSSDSHAHKAKAATVTPHDLDFDVLLSPSILAAVGAATLPALDLDALVSPD